MHTIALSLKSTMCGKLLPFTHACHSNWLLVKAIVSQNACPLLLAHYALCGLSWLQQSVNKVNNGKQFHPAVAFR